jgi:hypothetical protein
MGEVLDAIRRIHAAGRKPTVRAIGALAGLGVGRTHDLVMDLIEAGRVGRVDGVLTPLDSPEARAYALMRDAIRRGLTLTPEAMRRALVVDEAA